MSSDEKTTRVKVDSGSGMFWFMGWLFTLSFAHLGWGQAIVALVLWPYYLGVAVR